MSDDRFLREQLGGVAPRCLDRGSQCRRRCRPSSNGASSQRSVTRCFNWRSSGSSRRSRELRLACQDQRQQLLCRAFPYSRAAAAPRAARCSGSAPRPRPCAVISPVLGRSRSATSSRSSSSDLDSATSRPRSNFRPASERSRRRRGPGCRSTRNAPLRHRSDSSAARISVVFPVPASPISNVSGLADEQAVPAACSAPRVAAASETGTSDSP